MRQDVKALSYGDYEQLLLTNRQYAFARVLGDDEAIIAVNNDDNDARITVSAHHNLYLGVLSGQKVKAEGPLNITLKANEGEIFIPLNEETQSYEPVDFEVFEEEVKEEEAALQEEVVLPEEVRNVPYEDMTVEELQACILAKMAANGPVSDDMKRSVLENVYHDSLVNWVKSFR